MRMAVIDLIEYHKRNKQNTEINTQINQKKNKQTQTNSINKLCHILLLFKLKQTLYFPDLTLYLCQSTAVISCMNQFLL